jgi:uncharacterized protein (DUF1800 family)
MADTIEGRQAVAHLLLRAGFGPDAATWHEWRDLPFEEALGRILAGLDEPPPEDPAGFDPYVPGAIQQTWLERLRGGSAPLAEKLALFWHGHFATSDAKIQDPALMWTQYRLLRSRGTGRFADLLLGVSRDVAMIRWLDQNANRKGHANENYARELQELFSLGIGNYTETDVREVARAFTGWHSRHHEFMYEAAFHDDGEKTIHGKTGPFGGEEVIAILADLPACARFLAGKLLRFFSHPDPSAEEVEAVAAALRAADLSVRAGLEAVFRGPGFRAAGHRLSLVKGPVEFVVGSLRAAGVPEVPPFVHGALDRMGQILFRPPSVKGWPSGTAWLTSGAVVERLTTARRIAALAPEDHAETIAETAFGDDTPAELAEALAAVTGRDRVALVLGSPEFQMA